MQKQIQVRRHHSRAEEALTYDVEQQSRECQRRLGQLGLEAEAVAEDIDTILVEQMQTEVE